MIDGKNLSNNQIQKAMNKLNISSEDEINSYIKNNLNNKQTEMLNKFINNPEATNKLLSTPQAQKILENLFGKGE